ncbi:MAG: hypothetical protein GY694_09430 [Gammaproteobacteria bacterium]|nr:hypothetical protein [Gammaproteobacteria bacterium]
MSTFPLRQEEYSVEEISYDDMMLILKTQGEQEAAPQPATLHIKPSKQVTSKANDIAQRISENAKQQMPDWLMNH